MLEAVEGPIVIKPRSLNAHGQKIVLDPKTPSGSMASW